MAEKKETPSDAGAQQMDQGALIRQLVEELRANSGSEAEAAQRRQRDALQRRLDQQDRLRATSKRVEVVALADFTLEGDDGVQVIPAGSVFEIPECDLADWSGKVRLYETTEAAQPKARGASISGG